MDTLLHGVLGAVACSRTGLPGGHRGPVDDHGERRLTDWTLWAAFFFGIFPDIASLGIHFATDFFTSGSLRWHGIPNFVLVLYNITHSLLGIGIGYALLVAWKRVLWLPALAWPLHVLVDIPTHGSGRFMTPIFWPFTDAGFPGWSWWIFPWVFWGGWIVAGALWLLVVVLRLSWRKKS